MAPPLAYPLVDTSTFRIVGTFSGEGGHRGEASGDLERRSEKLPRTVRRRLPAEVKPGKDLEDVKERDESDLRTQPRVLTERAHLATQTEDLTKRFPTLGGSPIVIIGLGATITGTNSSRAAAMTSTQALRRG